MSFKKINWLLQLFYIHSLSWGRNRKKKKKGALEGTGSVKEGFCLWHSLKHSACRIWLLPLPSSQSSSSFRVKAEVLTLYGPVLAICLAPTPPGSPCSLVSSHTGLCAAPRASQAMASQGLYDFWSLLPGPLCHHCIYG